MERKDKPAADPERERLAAAWKREGLSPEEWAARNAHTIGASSFDQYRYADAALDDWIERVHVILRSRSLLWHCRQQHLTQAERDAIAAATGEDL
jgi:hypothetical protein